MSATTTTPDTATEIKILGDVNKAIKTAHRETLKSLTRVSYLDATELELDLTAILDRLAYAIEYTERKIRNRA